MPDSSQSNTANITKYLRLPLAALFREPLPEEPPPNFVLNLFLKSLITSSSSGGVWLLPPQGLFIIFVVPSHYSSSLFLTHLKSFIIYSQMLRYGQTPKKQVPRPTFSNNSLKCLFATNITAIYHCQAKAILPNKYFF